jgi:glycosyltransferase involved in cell wall biosynthesis
MTGDPRVSIVIPAFNAAATLARALDSVRAQSFTAWEAIVVDDAGREDGTAARVASYADSRLRLIRRSERGGPSRARNDGIAAARGEFIAFLDADDEWLPEKLARQVEILAKDPGVSLVACDMRALYEDGHEGLSVFARQAPVEGKTAWKALLASSFIGTSSVLTRRALLREFDGFDPGLAVGEDQDVFIRLAMRGAVVALPEQLAVYHYRGSSYSAGLATAQADHVLRMVRRHLADVGDSLTVRERRNILAQRYGRLGRNLIEAGAKMRGALLILGAALRGSIPRTNLAALAGLLR